VPFEGYLGLAMSAPDRPIPTSENSREYSVLDGKPSRVINFPLTISQQIWLMFLLPSFISTAIFIFDLSTDIGLAVTFFQEKLYLAASLTLLFTFLPAVVCYITRLLKPPQGQTNEGKCEWFFVETLAFILFPLRPLTCFAQRIFWALEAVRLPDPEREEALINHEESRRRNTESYLFFQAYLHAGPQALLQLILIVWGVSSNTHTIKIQVVGVLSSIASVALITASYQRYETQIRGKRRPVWKENPMLGNFESISKNEDDIDGNILPLPRQAKWVKTMEEDNPIGFIFAFLFWFLFLIGRCVCLVVAARFYPWVVLGVLVCHYILSLIYILPSPNFKESLAQKLAICFVFLFCLIEVGVTFKKALLWYTVVLIVTLLENLSLTLLWALWVHPSNWWYHYALFFLALDHAMAIIALLAYIKLFKPEIKKINPTTQE